MSPVERVNRALAAWLEAGLVYGPRSAEAALAGWVLDEAVAAHRAVSGDA